MQQLSYTKNKLTFERVVLDELVREFDTPLYVYSSAAVEANFRLIDRAFQPHRHLICYALKANTNPELLRRLQKLGAGADVVSGGELCAARRAGIPPDKIVFAGVGKRDDEILAALREGIRGINAESEMEVEVIRALARRTGTKARIALRVNPDIDIEGHPYISTGRHQDKFGIEVEQALHIAAELRHAPEAELAGLHAHLGSQIHNVAPYARLGSVLRGLYEQLLDMGHKLEYLDAGGGLGINYEQVIEMQPGARGQDEFALPPAQVAAALLAALGSFPGTLVFEPGRSIVAGAGLLLTRVLYIKETGGRKFAVVDAGMSDFMRVSLYNAHHAIVPAILQEGPRQNYDIVGPICESGDFFARDRELPAVRRGDVLAILTAGAYGFTLASNYNSRPLPAEVLIEEADARLIRARQPFDAIWPN